MTDATDTIPGFIRDPKARTISYFPDASGSVVLTERLEQLLLDVSRRNDQTARLCLHADPATLLHEMVIVQPKGQFFPPKKNLTKPKSFLCLHGKMAVFVFDDQGDIDEIHRLDSDSYPQRRLVRLAPGQWHCDISLTRFAMHFESNPGPFTGQQEHVMAPWGPNRDDPDDMTRFYAKLLDAVLP